MTFATAFLAAALVVPSMPQPEYADYEVITNCVFDDPTWNAAKIIRRGQSDPNLRVECSVDNIPLFIRIR